MTHGHTLLAFPRRAVASAVACRRSPPLLPALATVVRTLGVVVIDASVGRPHAALRALRPGRVTRPRRPRRRRRRRRHEARGRQQGRQRRSGRRCFLLGSGSRTSCCLLGSGSRTSCRLLVSGSRTSCRLLGSGSVARSGPLTPRGFVVPLCLPPLLQLQHPGGGVRRDGRAASLPPWLGRRTAIRWRARGRGIDDGGWRRRASRELLQTADPEPHVRRDGHTERALRLAVAVERLAAVQRDGASDDGEVGARGF
jgi:hypothetical protein